MKFYNRTKEFGLLHRIENSKGLRVVILKGLRRIGKTSLVLNWLKGKNMAYLFIPKDKTPELFLEETCAELNIPKFVTLNDFIRYVLERYDFVFFDEFQNFYYIDKSTFSLLQKIIDEYSEKQKNVCIVVSGSSYSLMRKIFSDYSKALYGRKDIEITLDEFNVTTVMQILQDLGVKNIEDRMKFWAVFGGVPRFYTMLEKLGVTEFGEFEKEFLFTNMKTMLDEGASILISEFGGEYKSYYTVMEAIATGKTTHGEIASVFGNDPIVANRYLDQLRNEYYLVARNTPITADVKGRQGIYSIKNNFLRFWFCFLKRYESFYEQNRVDEIAQAYSGGFNAYLGRAFEDFCILLIKTGALQNQLPFQPESVGKEWGSYLGNDDEKVTEKKKARLVYDIDIVATNDREKKILFAECKWSERVDAGELVAALSKKAQFVGWRKNERTEAYAVFARSFSKRMTIYEGKSVCCLDLNDLIGTKKAEKKLGGGENE